MQTLARKFRNFAANRNIEPTQAIREAFFSGAAAVASELIVQGDELTDEEIEQLGREAVDTLDRYADEINRFAEEVLDHDNRTN